MFICTHFNLLGAAAFALGYRNRRTLKWGWELKWGKWVCRRRRSCAPPATFGRDSERDVRNAVTACRADGRNRGAWHARAVQNADLTCAMRTSAAAWCNNGVGAAHSERLCSLCSRSAGIDWWAPPTPHSASRLWYALYSQSARALYAHCVCCWQEATCGLQSAKSEFWQHQGSKFRPKCLIL